MSAIPNPQPDCQWVALEGTIQYLPSRQRHILFCKCQACVEASAAHRVGKRVSTDPEVARRIEVLSTAS